MRKVPKILSSLLLVILFGGLLGIVSAQELNCSTWETRSKPFSAFENPLIGFTRAVIIDGTEYAGWYIIEAKYASHLPLKAYFIGDYYIDGLEIGERFVTPKEEWGSGNTPDYPNLLAEYADLTKYAPDCWIK